MCTLWTVATDEHVKFRQFADDIERRIRSGEFLPGAQLTPARELREYYGTSPGTMTKTVNELVARGLVETRQGKGTFVCDPLPEPGAPSEFEQLMAAVQELSTTIADIRCENRTLARRVADLERRILADG